MFNLYTTYNNPSEDTNFSMIRYVTGDATNPDVSNSNVIIVHICNNKKKWGKGFVLSLSKKWPILRSRYMSMSQLLGTVDIVRVSEHICVANMIAQDGVNTRYRVIERVNHKELRNCLEQVYTFASLWGMEVHMPKIGSGLGGSKWEDIEQIIKPYSERVPTTVYTL